MQKHMSRRSFLGTSSKSLAAAAALPLFARGSALTAAAAPAAEEWTLNDYFDHFQVNQSTVKQVMATALAKGGDYCDLYFQHNIATYIGLEDKSVNRAYTKVDLGVGIRVLKGDQTGYSFTEEITPEAMKRAAATAANIADSKKTFNNVELKPHDVPSYYPVKIPWEDVSVDQKIPALQKINDKMFSLDNRVIKSSIWFGNETSYVLMVTSDGRMVYDYRPMGFLATNCIAEQNGRREQNGYSLSYRHGYEMITDETLDKLANEAVSRTVLLFDAVKPEAGEMPVVLAAGGSGILLHEAIGHGMEADFNRKEVSIFSDKMNKRVANEYVTIVDDATQKNVRGSLNIDDEANDTENTVLVENGILRSYLHDRISAKHYGVNPTGNGRRQSFRYAPQPRMRNTYMLPGPHKKEEIIASVKKGLYAESFTNGEVFIGAGDFTFYVKTGFLIEDGKITKPVKDVNIIGNGPDVLSKITMVADDVKIDKGTWTCGKGGQGVPVSQGLPTVKVSEITVGGTNS